jgi:S1-C subfamily serine protease
MDEQGGLDIEKLSKSQIILLTLLVSFVTSIATGIITVSLMDQAPPAIAQTVNRVVERTVEKVMPAVQTASVGQTTKTIVIKESDLIAQAIQQVRPSVVRLYSTDDKPVFLGLGLVLNKTGVIVADTRVIADSADVVIEQAGGQHVDATVLRRDSDNGFAYLTTATTTVDGKPASWTPAALATAPASLGQTIFTISGKSVTSVGDGIIASVAQNADQPLLDTNIPADSIGSGSPLIDMDGNIEGISTGIGRDISASAFMPSSLISIEAKVVAKPADKPTDEKKPQ